MDDFPAYRRLCWSWKPSRSRWSRSRRPLRSPAAAATKATPTKTLLERKYTIILFVLLFSITLTYLTSTEMANYPVTKLVGVALKLRKLNEKFAVFTFSTKSWNSSFQFDVLQRTAKNIPTFKTRVQNCCLCSLSLLLCDVFTAVAVVTGQLPNSYGTRLKWYRHKK